MLGKKTRCFPGETVENICACCYNGRVFLFWRFPLKSRLSCCYKLLRPIVILLLKCVFGYTYTRADNLPANYIVLSNHATDFDPLLVGASFRQPMYFVASEHIARWPVVGKLITWLLQPIYRNKGASAASTVMEILRHTRKGHNVCMFAEGTRTWDGVTCPILPSTAKMVKSAGCGLVTYKLIGGYFTSPRWGGASIRRGMLHGAPVRVYTPETLQTMSNEELHAAITRDLYEDAYARQLASPKRYRSRKRAMFMERLLFICPQCGSRDTIRSAADTVSCTHCGIHFRYTPYGMLEGIPYSTVKELSDWQKAQVLQDIENGTPYTAPNATLTTLRNHEEALEAQGAVTMTSEFLCCGDFRVALEDIVDLNIHGQKAIVFTAHRTYYELRPAEGINALKFHLYYHGCKEKRAARV